MLNDNNYRRVDLCHSVEEGGRLPLYSLFVYLVHKGNHIQFGLGYESRDQLQRVHVPTDIEHLENSAWMLERLDSQGLILKTGKLKELFGDRNHLILVCRDDASPSVCLGDGERMPDPYIQVGDEFIAHWREIRDRNCPKC